MSNNSGFNDGHVCKQLIKDVPFLDYVDTVFERFQLQRFQKVPFSSRVHTKTDENDVS
jgi:hypothetical protein